MENHNICDDRPLINYENDAKELMFNDIEKIEKFLNVTDEDRRVILDVNNLPLMTIYTDFMNSDEWFEMLFEYFSDTLVSYYVSKL